MGTGANFAQTTSMYAWAGPSGIDTLWTSSPVIYDERTSGAAPSAAPTVPAVSGTPTDTSITVTFDVVGITGTPTPTYSIVYGTTATPVTPFAATLVSGTTWQAIVTGLLASTDYYFKSVATNTSGTQTSAVSAAISTASVGPVVAPTASPRFVSFTDVTSTTITVNYNSDNVTVGTPPLVFSVWQNTSGPITPPSGINETLVAGVGTALSYIWTGLDPSATYYFASQSENSAGYAAASFGWHNQTTDPPDAAPDGTFSAIEIYIAATSTTIPVQFTYTPGADFPLPTLTISASLTMGGPYTIGPFATTGSGSYIGTVTGLTSTTNYYIIATATNSSGHTDSAEAMFSTT